MSIRSFARSLSSSSRHALHRSGRGAATVLLGLFASLVTSAEITVPATNPWSALSGADLQTALQQAWSPTQVHIPAGRQTLDQALAALRSSGLDVQRYAAMPADQVIDFPGFEGNAWDALLTLCTWFDLRLLPGVDASGEQWWNRGDDGQSMPWQTGTVTLAPVGDLPANPITAIGALLAEAHTLELRQTPDATSMDIALRLRLEPIARTMTIGDIRVVWNSVQVDGLAVEATPVLQGPDQVGLLHLNNISSLAPYISLQGEARIMLQEPFDISVDLQPGDTAIVPLGDQQATIQLLDRDQAKANGRRGACILFSYPGTALSGPFELSAIDGEVTISNSGSSSRHDVQGSSEQVQYVAGLGAGVHHVHVVGLRRLGTIVKPIQCTIDGGALPQSPTSLRQASSTQATIVQWPGGPTSLRDAIIALRGSGNDILVDLGVDVQQTAELQPFNGTFWQGCLHVMQAYDISLLPAPAADATVKNARVRAVLEMGQDSTAATATFTGGAVRLGQRRSDTTKKNERHVSPTFFACGPMLAEVVDVQPVTIRTLTGTSRNLMASLRLRLEPQVDVSRIQNGTVAWATACGQDQAGTVAAAPTDTTTPAAAGTLTVAITDVPSQHGPLLIQGLAAYRLQQDLQATATLELEQSTTVQLAGRTVTVRLLTVRDDGQTGLSLTFQRDSFDDRIEATVTTADGRAFEQRGRSSRGQQRQMEDQWTIPGLEANRPYTITLSTLLTQAKPVLPISVTIPGTAGNPLPSGVAADHLPSP